MPAAFPADLGEVYDVISVIASRYGAHHRRKIYVRYIQRLKILCNGRCLVKGEVLVELNTISGDRNGHGLFPPPLRSIFRRAATLSSSFCASSPAVVAPPPNI